MSIIVIYNVLILISARKARAGFSFIQKTHHMEICFASLCSVFEFLFLFNFVLPLTYSPFSNNNENKKTKRALSALLVICHRWASLSVYIHIWYNTHKYIYIYGCVYVYMYVMDFRKTNQRNPIAKSRTKRYHFFFSEKDIIIYPTCLLIWLEFQDFFFFLLCTRKDHFIFIQKFIDCHIRS